MRPFIILTGASGTGKTIIAEAVRDRYGAAVETFFFDSIAIPSSAEFARMKAAGIDWQRDKTLEWMARIAKHETFNPILFEGSTRIAYLREGLAQQRMAGQIILIDCDDATRAARLAGPRGQSELDNADMTNWAAYLRREAIEHGCEIWDTTQRTLDESVAHVIGRLGIGSVKPVAAARPAKPKMSF